MCRSNDDPSQSSLSPTGRPENPYTKASFFSKLIFKWPYPLLKLGMQRPLEEADLADVTEIDTSVYNLEYFLRVWENERQRNPKRPSLHRALLVDYIRSIWYIQPMLLISSTARVLQAVVLGLLIDSFAGENDNGYLWASMLVACGMVILIEHHHVFWFTWRKGMQLRVSAVAAIYEKSLRLSSTHQDTSASYGRIMNLASNDVERFLMASLFISYIFWAPVESIGILVVGYFLLGPAFIAGFGLLVAVLVPLQFYFSGKFAYYRSKIAQITDKRVAFVSQAIRGARVMKMSGYEWRFLEQIQEFRRLEIAEIARANNLKAWNEALFFSTNVVVSVVIFVVHVFTGGTLKAGDVFTVFTLINILQLQMTKHVPLGVMGASECYVSITRIQKFLEFPELPEYEERFKVKPNGKLDLKDVATAAISLSNVMCQWNEVKHTRHVQDSAIVVESDPSLFLALEDISLEFPRGELAVIIGTVGSGKSALIQALVQELPVTSGTITRRYDSLAYACQDPWIMDGTVKDNIIMGMELDEKWYNTVVEACCLVTDFQQLRDGDQTIVGDRGAQCSGGQRARIGLARAIYRDSDVLVADDPLSAVDARVGRLLFQEAIQGLMIKRGKSVILATHQHQYVNESRCILMDNGRIGCTGSYEECVTASGGKLTAHAADDTVDSLAETPEVALKIKVYNNDDDDYSVEEDVKIRTKDDDNKEMNIQGLVQKNTYMMYLRAMGGVWVGLFLTVLFSITQASVLVTIAAIGRWAQRPPSEQDDWNIAGLILGLGGVVVVLGVFRSFISFRLTVNASRKLHDRMTKAVIRAKIEFFDTNPLGRIVNRFSADVGSNDDMLPPTLFDFFMIAFIVLGAVVTTIITLPFTLIAIPPLLWYFLSVRRFFVTSTRELKRLEGLARSPIYAMLSESLGGIATIRSNDSVEFFRKKFQTAHDGHTRPFFAFMASSRWVGFRMDSIMFFFVAVVSYMAVLFNKEGWFNVDPTDLGLSLSMLLQLAGIFQWCIRQSAEVVNLMVSVERVNAFGDLEPEAPLEMENDKALLERGWPAKGAIDVEGLSVRYRVSLPLALEKASFFIPAGSRVGVVGRTGSGKSTVVQTLFRLLEADAGCIKIDGVDVSTIGLHALRTKISVIPQHPTLFSGCSVRENLDLFGLHSDDELRKVLDDCHLADVIRNLANGWDSLISEGGSNFSVGQRQLLCLARAILSDNKILGTFMIDSDADSTWNIRVSHYFFSYSLASQSSTKPRPTLIAAPTNCCKKPCTRRFAMVPFWRWRTD